MLAEVPEEIWLLDRPEKLPPATFMEIEPFRKSAPQSEDTKFK